MWRMLAATPGGRKRALALNLTVESDLHVSLYSLGVGRYRVEWRDRRRFVVRVEVWEVRDDGVVARVAPMQRRRAKTVPPPQHVAPGTRPWDVSRAPIVVELRPERGSRR